jgi:hypothetical protein
MPDHDDLFKELICTFFFEFLELFIDEEFVSDLERCSEIQLDKEFPAELGPGRAHRADLVFSVGVKSSKKQLLIHIEIESSNNKNIAKRMFFYYSSLCKKYDCEILPIAIFSFRSPRKPVQTELTLLAKGRKIGSFSFTAIQLNLLDWRAYLGIKNPVASALMSCMRYREIERPEVKLESLRHLASQRLTPEDSALVQRVIDAYLELSDAEKIIFAQKLKELEVPERTKIMTYITSWQREGMEIGLEKGRVEGRVEGRAEGSLHEALKLVKRMLTKKFGNVGQETVKKIEALNQDRLEQLAEDLLDFSEMSDLENWLVHNTSDTE